MRQIPTSHTGFFHRFLVIGHAAVLLGLLLLLSGIGAAQEIPCPDARAEKGSFISPSKRSLSDGCRARRIAPLPQKADGMVDVQITGHVTHQNGVRMPGITMSLRDLNANTTRTVVTDDLGRYAFLNIPWGSRVELMPTGAGYEFYPPAVIWEGIVEDEVWNFIAVGPPPTPPPPPANQPTLAWTSYYDNTPQLADYNAMLGRDSLGNIYVAGSTNAHPDSGDTDIAIFKTDPLGNRVWSRTYNGAGNYKEGAADMIVDAAGNTYIAGYTYNVGEGEPPLRSFDYLVLKYNPAGELQWSRQYAGNRGYDDFATSIALDASGNVIVGGYSWGVGTYANYATVKYDADGNQLWAQRYAGGYGEIMNEVEVDAAGNVYVTGYSGNSMAGGSEDIVTIKYNAAGDQLWLNRYNSPADVSDEGYDLELTSTGDVLVIGDSYDLGDTTPLLHKINGATGATVWTRPLNFTDGQFGEYPVAIELDASGNIFVTGMLAPGFSYDADVFLAKLDAEAATLWFRSYDGPSDEDYDGDPKLVLDPAGNAILALSSEGFANADIQVIKYLADGTEDWTYRFGNPFFGSDWLPEAGSDAGERSILLDAAGNVYIAGDSFIPEQSTDMGVFKLEPVASARAVQFDFDGDRKADIAVFRPDTGVWYVLKSSDGDFTATAWGLANDKIVPADYDGDRKMDAAVFRDGTWYVMKSSDGGYAIENFGIANDRPVPADFDNDGKADLSVFRDGIWHKLNSADRSYKAEQFGIAGDIPIPSDYDRNRRSDVAVYRGGTWFVRYQAELPMAAIEFGLPTDKVVPADYDGDGQTDHAVFRDGTWYVWMSTIRWLKVFQWGSPGDIPVPADYDGDRKADFAVYRGGTWYIFRSSDATYTIAQFGIPTDIPIPSAYNR